MRHYFHGTEGILTALPKVQIWCTVAGLVCFSLFVERIAPFFFAVFNSTSLCKIHENFYCLTLFLAFGKFFFAGCIFLSSFLLNRY